MVGLVAGTSTMSRLRGPAGAACLGSRTDQYVFAKYAVSTASSPQMAHVS